MVEELGCGLLVEPDAVAEHLDSIACLLEDGALARELGTRGRERVLGELNWECEAEKLIAVYDRMLRLPEGSRTGTEGIHD